MVQNRQRAFVALLLFATAAGAQGQSADGASATKEPARAQTTQSADSAQGAAQLPPFDVVSVKPHKDEGMMMRSGVSATPDGFAADGVQLHMLIRQAFGLSEDRILNVPDWARSARFDIEAKVAPEDAAKLQALSWRQRGEMLLPVLQDRFGLKYHHETKELQVYALVAAKGGPKLKEAKPAEDGASAAGPPSAPLAPSDARGGVVAARAGTGATATPGTPRTIMRMTSQGATLDAHGTPMATLAQILSQQVGATVIDKTGLPGNYDFTLSFMPDMATGTGPMMRPPGAGSPPEGAQAQEPVGPSVFAALPEQLGLKLESQKQPLDVIVIDHVEQPSAN